MSRMSIFCIGDIHGDYKGFLEIIKNIEYDKQKDQIYILGDIFGGESGGINIVNWIYENQSSVFLIRGNHELFVEKAVIPSINLIKNYKLENKFHLFLETYSDKLWNQFFKCVQEDYCLDYIITGNTTINFSKMTYEEFIDGKKIAEWITVSKTRKKIALSYFKLVKNISDINKVINLNSMLEVMPQYRAKPTVLELLKLDISKLKKLTTFLEDLQNNYTFTYEGKDYFLTHEFIGDSRLRHTFGTKNLYVIYGHTPVALLHRNIYSKSFDFDYKKNFAYIDIFNNHYYNLDLSASKVISALRLDDLKEYYSNSDRDNRFIESGEEVDQKKFQGIEQASFPDGRIVKREDGNDIFLTCVDNCYEFVVAYIPTELVIYYYRVDYLNMFNLLQNYRIEIKSQYKERNNIYKIVKNHYFENGFEDNGAVWSKLEQLTKK